MRQQQQRCWRRWRPQLTARAAAWIMRWFLNAVVRVQHWWGPTRSAGGSSMMAVAADMRCAMSACSCCEYYTHARVAVAVALCSLCLLFAHHHIVCVCLQPNRRRSTPHPMQQPPTWSQSTSTKRCVAVVLVLFGWGERGRQILIQSQPSPAAAATSANCVCMPPHAITCSTNFLTTKPCCIASLAH